VATRPSDFRIERETTIAAPPEIVFANLDDFRRWLPWSPWEKLDSGMKREYTGPESGVGARYHWVGSDAVGEGRMEITASEPPKRLALRLEFVAPMQATNEVVFALEPAAAGTTVKWSMSGTNGFVQKAFGVFVDVDAMVGADFERGLADLTMLSEADFAAKQAAEAAAAQAAAAPAAAEAPAQPEGTPAP
jgi:uncharacterized protein YndB with AHSA1/START domain